MPSELWNRNKINNFFGKITTFLDGPYENEVAKNFTKGQFTDDTAQALIIIDALNKNHFEPSKKIIADALIEWANATNAFENNILGPSSKAALTAIKRGEDPHCYTKNALTNGAAMRIAPIGTLFSKDQKLELINYVKGISETTHTSDVAIAGASMIAYAVTLAVEDKHWEEIIEGVLDIHEIAINEGAQTFSASISERLKLAVQFANHFENGEAYSRWLYDVIGCGTSLTESVPTALAIAYFCKDPHECAIFCANIGGDTDTIGAMATAISGAKYGYSNFNKLWIETIDKHNNVNLDQYATTLEKNKML